MSEIEDMLSQIYAVEEDLVITSPISVGIKKVWPYVPPMRDVVSSTPAFVHGWTLTNLEIGSAVIRETYVLNIKLCVYDSSSEKAAHIAAAFWPKIRYALSQNIKFGLAGWNIGALQGGSPTLTTFTEGEVPTAKTLVGLDLNLTLHHRITSSNAAGSPP